MDVFWIFIGFVALFFYVRNSISALSTRITYLEQKLGASPAQSQAQAREMPASQSELAKEGVHRGDMFAAALSEVGLEKTQVFQAPPQATSAPTPAPVYAEAALTPEQVKFANETQEETSARWLGRIGAIAVLIGMAFFLKYAFDNNWVGPTGRVALGIIAGLATIGVGQKLRAKYLNYSDMLTGVGIAILYLSIYASYSFYHLVDPSVAFVLMGLVTTFGLVLAIAGSTLGLAVLSTLGGFMTPVLLSTGENHLAALSIYMIILDLGVFGVAWFKKWTQLNYLSFVGTIVLFGGSMAKFYTPPQLGETFFFVSVFFAIFLLTSILHHVLRKEPTTPSDLMLLVLNAAGYFAVSAYLLDPTYHDVLGFFALILAVLYLGVTYIAFSSNKSDRTLNLFLPGIAVVFLTIAIPLQLDGYYVSLSWLVESIVLIATGLYLRERVIQAFGWIVLMVGMVSMGQDVENIRNGMDRDGRYTQTELNSTQPFRITPFFNMGFFLMMVAIAVFYGVAALYHRFRDDEAEWRKFALFSVVMANIVTMLSFSSELMLEHHSLVSLVWFIESIALLYIGLREKNRIVEVIGWIGLLGGLSIMWDGVTGIRSGIPDVQGITNTPPEPITAFLNTGFFLMLCGVATFYAFVALYVQFKEQIVDWKKSVGVILVLANILTIAVITSEIEFSYDQDIGVLYSADAKAQQAYNNYTGGGYQNQNQFRSNVPSVASYEKISSLESSKNTAVSIFWALYAILMIAIGFAKRMRFIRLFGLVFFFVTAGRVFLEVWQLGQLERIISSMVFGVIALGASFLYVKYKHLLTAVVNDD